jgi:amino acid permease
MSAFAALIVWYVSATASTIINKLLVVGSEAPRVIGVMGLSSINTAVATLCDCILIVSLVGNMSMLKNIKKKTCFSLLPVSAAVVLSKTLTYHAYRYIPLSLSHTVKGLLPVFSALIQYTWLGRVPSKRVCTALSIILFGIFSAASTDLSFNVIGFMAVMSATLFASFQSVWLKQNVFLQNRSTSKVDSVVGVVEVHMIVALQATILGGLVLLLELLSRIQTGKIGAAHAYYFVWPSTGVLLVSAMQWMGSIASYVFLASNTSAVSHNIAKIGQRVLLIVISVLLFRNPISRFNVIGSGISILGIYMYTRAVAAPKQDSNDETAVLPVSSNGTDGQEYGPESSRDLSVKQGTFGSTIFMLFNSILGTGILTVPYAFSVAGRAGGVLMLLLFGLVELWTMFILVDSSEATGRGSYSALIVHSLGAWWGRLLSIILAIYCFFLVVGALIIVKNVMPPFLMMLCSSPHHNLSGEIPIGFAYVSILITGVFAYPLLLLRDISSLRFAAFVAFLAVVYAAYVVISFSFTLSSEVDSPKTRMWGQMPAITFAAPLLSLSFHAHIQVPTIYMEMRSDLRQPLLMKKAIGIVYFVCALLYISIGLAGYTTFGEKTCPNILACPYDHANTSILFSRCCLVITSTLSIPLSHRGARDALWSVAEYYGWTLPKGASVQLIPTSFILAEATIFFCCAVGLSMLIDQVSTVSSIMGMTAGVFIIFLLPARFIYKSSPRRAILLSCFGGVTSLLCALSMVYPYLEG